MFTPRTTRASILEVAVLVLAVVLLIAILIPASGGSRSSPQTMDSMQLRMMVQSQTLWTESNGGRFAFPSDVDVNNTTVDEAGRTKDTTANIYSLLIYNGLLTPEMLTSPVERGNVEKDDDYELASPSTAVKPASALWDPAFRADFTGRLPGNASYAHAVPHPLDGGPWQGAFSETRPVFSNRGPYINGVTYKANGDIDTIDSDRHSITNRFYGNRRTWSGHIAYNDNSVLFETDLAPLARTSSNTKADPPDLIFFDEPTPGNALLSIFTTGGDTREDFTAIWD